MNVLGIETSCDETAAAVVDGTGVRSDVVHTQLVHAAYGGVVPELASRAHTEKIGPTVRAALDQAGVSRPDAVVATGGPGLIGAVLVGFSFGKALAAGWNVPFLAINHLEGHMLAPMLETPAPVFPFLALVVSGGHCAIYACRGVGQYEVLGQTLDDAAGEAYDKVARLLSLGYPGGPAVDRLAQDGDPAGVVLPRPLPGALDFSFSGLKTAVRTAAARSPRASDADLCASFQAAVVDCLLDRVRKASRATGLTQIAVTGGVAANSELRRRVAGLGLDVFIPPKARCTDNAAMIASVGRLRLMRGDRDPLDVGARPAWQPA
jgi:N6-L-threonylcarbamoyladenine synthase